MRKQGRKRQQQQQQAADESSALDENDVVVHKKPKVGRIDSKGESTVPMNSADDGTIGVERESDSSKIATQQEKNIKQHSDNKDDRARIDRKRPATQSGSSTKEERKNSKKSKSKHDISGGSSSKTDDNDKADSTTNDTSKVQKRSIVQKQYQQHPLSFHTLRNPSLSESVLQFIDQQGFQYMTPVQAATIPQLLSFKDVAVQAVTGSGKTLAFLIPVMEMMLRRCSDKTGTSKLKKTQIGALILSPTRELAQQTYTVAMELCKACDQPEPLLLVGGGSSSSSSGTNTRPVTADLQTFAKLGSNIVIGTPGRVDDILNRYTVMDTSELDCLILDEADVLLNMGFATTLTNILSRLPKMRRTGLFSATQSTSGSSSSSSVASSMKELMHKMGMRNPIWIDVAVASSNNNITNNVGTNDKSMVSTNSNEENREVRRLQHQQQATPSSLTNYYIVSKPDEKLSRLVCFLRQHKHEKVIVFFLTCACVDFYGTAVKECTEINVEMLHGKMVQKRREKSMERFRTATIVSSTTTIDNDGNIDSKSSKWKKDKSVGDGVALFCTDVAARGLDVSDIQWVVQYDAPQDPAFYIHRVGRAARAGRTGSSLLFISPKEEAYIDFLSMRKVPLQPLPTTEHCCPPPPVDDDNDDDDDNNDDTIESNDKQTNAAAGSNDNNSDRRIIIRSASDPTLVIDDILPVIRKLVLTDRDVLEKGTKAYTSYIRAYKEHHCGFIFRFVSLDLGMLANSFCLLRLPKMPELRDAVQRHKGKLPHFHSAGPDVDIFAIPYKDKPREVARQKRLKEVILAGGKNAKEIKAEQRKADKERRVLDRREQAIDKGRNPDKKRGRHAQLVDEWDDLAKEERLYKKLRKKQITEEEYNDLMHQL